MTKEVKIVIGVGIIVLVGGIFLLTQQPRIVEPSKPVDSKSLIRENSHMTGKKDAKVTVVEFGDFECPYCAQAEPDVERLRADYKSNNDVNFVFRNFPLSQHEKAQTAAEAAEAAGEQGKYWEMHDLLYIHQTDWVGTNDAPTVFANFAQQIGLDVGKFKTDWAANKYADVINADEKDGEGLNVNSTPTFFVNGEQAQSFTYDSLKKLIDDKLK